MINRWTFLKTIILTGCGVILLNIQILGDDSLKKITKKVKVDKLALKATKDGAINIPFIQNSRIYLDLRDKPPKPRFPLGAKQTRTFLDVLVMKTNNLDKLTIELNYGIICDNIKKTYTPQVELKLLDKNDKALRKVKQQGSFSLTPPFRHRVIRQDELIFNFDKVDVGKVAKISIMVK